MRINRLFWTVSFCTLAALGATGGRVASTRIWGITIDDTSNASVIADSLKSLSARPMARIVFDAGTTPADYNSDVDTIRKSADIMGEPVDSSDVKATSAAKYHARMVQFFDAMKSRVDLWEIGNEVNGDWLGTPTSVSAKVVDAYDEAKKRNLKTAITLYYNSSCCTNPTYEMVTWARVWLADRVRQGVDYVFVSYYPDDCSGTPNWKNTFSALQTIFPKAKLGFGEIYLKNSAKKDAFIRSFYGMNDPVSNFVGGYFYWYFKQDAVPKTKSLWKTFKDVIR